MADPIVAMRAVADLLDQTDLKYAFVGGSIVNSLLDYPALSPARPTDDVDVIVEVVASQRYSVFEARIQELGFKHDMSKGAPMCRWLLDDLKVYMMPTEGAALGLNTQWFAEALATAEEKPVRDSIKLRIISSVGFLATKIVAFYDRGGNNYYTSEDIEDLLTVIDGRAGTVKEVAAGPIKLRQFIRDSIRQMNSVGDFREAASGALGFDEASQRRLPLLLGKLREIADLPD